jgi:hypothetical protein
VRPAVKALLVAKAGGDTGALDRLMTLIYADLRRIARTQLRRRRSLSLDTAGLVHDVYLRLVDQSQVQWRIAATSPRIRDERTWRYGHLGGRSRSAHYQPADDVADDRNQPDMVAGRPVIAFRSEREGPGLFRQDAQGAGPVERLTTTEGPIHSPYSWTPDGRTLLIALFRSFSRQAIGAVTPPDQTVRVLLDEEFARLDPQVSPDGRWLAYQSDETGRFEIYLRPYPDVKSGRWQVSSNGGTSPRFSPDGREILYYDGTGLASVAFSAVSGRPTRGAPVKLFPIAVFGGRFGPDYEVAPAGRRFMFIVEGQAAELPRAHVVYVRHWAEELRTRLGER